jgi:C4-dicarboxylate transporter DctM subunit
MEPQSIILLMTPIFMPITNSLGIPVVALGTFTVVNIAVGMMTPPVAGCIYVSNQMAGLQSIGPMVQKIVPYLLVMMFITLLITYFPEISLVLPRMLGMNVN